MIIINSIEELEKYKKGTPPLPEGYVYLGRHKEFVCYDYEFKENNQWADVTFNIEIKLGVNDVAQESGKKVFNCFIARNIYANKQIIVGGIVVVDNLVCKDKCAAFYIAGYVGGAKKVKGKNFSCNNIACKKLIADRVGLKILTCYEKFKVKELKIWHNNQDAIKFHNLKGDHTDWWCTDDCQPLPHEEYWKPLYELEELAGDY